MIRARGEGKNGKPIMILGVSRANVERLISGDPIRATGESVGIGALDSVVIFFGENEAVMAEDLLEAGLVTDETVVHDERHTPKRTTG